jgi:hypothetical protein
MRTFDDFWIELLEQMVKQNVTARGDLRPSLKQVARLAWAAATEEAEMRAKDSERWKKWQQYEFSAFQVEAREQDKARAETVSRLTRVAPVHQQLGRWQS